MRKTILSLTLFIFFVITFALPEMASAEWRNNTVVNRTTENLYVIYSTWRGASSGVPRGYRTRGYYRIDPGRQRTFRAWANNRIYFQIQKGGEPIKPQVSTETFGFWVHPSAAFTVVSRHLNSAVTRGQLTHSDHPVNALAQEEGFLRYSNGASVTVTSRWVSVSGDGETDPDEGTSLDVNGDGVIDTADVAFVAARLGQSGNTAADVDGDGVVTVADVQLVSEAIGTDGGGTGEEGDTDGPAAKITTQPDGRTMVLIPAGEFQMGSNDAESNDNEQPVRTVYVDAFYMDEIEVTNAQFKEFVLENPRWQQGRIDSSFTDTNYLRRWSGNNYPIGKDNHPVQSVSWYAAMAYAEWAGKRLPTEAEWEKAARGGLVGKQYPHGNTITKRDANSGANVKDINRETTAVGRYPANAYGLYDMAGNVFEWCLDEYDKDFYFTFPRNGAARNPLSGANSVAWLVNNFTNVNRKSLRVFRGGSYYSSSASSLGVARRSGGYPRTSSYVGSGFRCVRSVTP